MNRLLWSNKWYRRVDLGYKEGQDFEITFWRRVVSSCGKNELISL